MSVLLRFVITERIFSRFVGAILVASFIIQGELTYRHTNRKRFIQRRYEGLQKLRLSNFADWPAVLLNYEVKHDNFKATSDVDTNSIINKHGEAVEHEATIDKTIFSNDDTLNKPDVETKGVVNLPPMDAAAVNDLNQPQMPTFDEYQAMVSDANHQRKRQADAKPTEPSFVIQKPEFDDPGHSASIKGKFDKAHMPSNSGDANVSGETSINSNNKKETHNDASNAETTSDMSPSPEAPITVSQLSVQQGAPNSAGGVKESVQGPSVIQLPSSEQSSLPPPTQKPKVTFILPSSVQEPLPVAKDVPEADTTKNIGSNTHIPVNAPSKPSLRMLRNIAAVECGAKLLLASPSAKYAHAVLVDNNDMYMNQPCASEKWFILETCEPVQLNMVQIANYELFSSRCKTFKVYVSDRYPAKEWELLGTFQAYDVKGLQSFDLQAREHDPLIKYVKFEILDHYGNEHFCPITMVRLFGLVADDLDEAAAEAEAVSERQQLRTTDPLLIPPPIGSSTSVRHEQQQKSPLLDQESITVGLSGDDVYDSPPTPVVPPARATGGHWAQTADLPSPTGAAELSGNAPMTVTGVGAQADPAVQPVDASPREPEKAKNCSRGGSCVLEVNDEATAFTLFQTATRFIVNILRGAVRSTQSPSELTSKTSRNNQTHIVGESLEDLSQPTSDDFYTVIFLFTSVCPHLAAMGQRQRNCVTTPLLSFSESPLPKRTLSLRVHKGLMLLGECLLDLNTMDAVGVGSFPPKLASPHWAWPSCAGAFQLLNLSCSEETTVSLAENASHHGFSLLRLLSAYQNVTQTFHLLDSPPLGYADLETLLRLRGASLPPRFHGVPPLPSFLIDQKQLSPIKKNLQVMFEPVYDSPKADKEAHKTDEHLPDSRNVISVPPMEEVVVPASIGGSRKETVYMRLSNKVRQIEADVSVSMRYLQELSQSYKRQTERLSRSFNLTTAWLQATAKGAEERDRLQQVRIDLLEQRMSHLIDLLADNGLLEVIRSATNVSEYAFYQKSTSVSKLPTGAAKVSDLASPMVGDLTTFLWAALLPAPPQAANFFVAQSHHQQIPLQTHPRHRRLPFKSQQPDSVAASTTILMPEHLSNLTGMLQLTATLKSRSRRVLMTRPQQHILSESRGVLFVIRMLENCRLLIYRLSLRVVTIFSSYMPFSALEILFYVVLHVSLATLIHLVIYWVFLRRFLCLLERRPSEVPCVPPSPNQSGLVQTISQVPDPSSYPSMFHEEFLADRKISVGSNSLAPLPYASSETSCSLDTQFSSASVSTSSSYHLVQKPVECSYRLPVYDRRQNSLLSCDSCIHENTSEFSSSMRISPVAAVYPVYGVGNVPLMVTGSSLTSATDSVPISSLHLDRNNSLILDADSSKFKKSVQSFHRLSFGSLKEKSKKKRKKALVYQGAQ